MNWVLICAFNSCTIGLAARFRPKLPRQFPAWRPFARNLFGTTLRHFYDLGVIHPVTLQIIWRKSLRAIWHAGDPLSSRRYASRVPTSEWPTIRKLALTANRPVAARVLSLVRL